MSAVDDVAIVILKFVPNIKDAPFEIAKSVPKIPPIVKVDAEPEEKVTFPDVIVKEFKDNAGTPVIV
jgi:hypothetical protein